MNVVDRAKQLLFQRKNAPPPPAPVGYGSGVNPYMGGLPVPGAYDARSSGESPIVTSCNSWMVNSIHPLGLEVVVGERPAPNHRFVQILRKPNEQTGWKGLLEDTIRSRYVFGATHYELLENGFSYVSYYNLRPPMGEGPWNANGRSIPQDKMFRWVWNYNEEGTYPQSPLAAVNDFIQLNDATAENAYGRMKSPSLGVVIQRKDGPPTPPSVAEKMKEALAKVSGRGAGEAVVFTSDGEAKELRGAHQQFDFADVHGVCAKFICSVYGIPPRVLGLSFGDGGALVDSSFASEVRLAWQEGVSGLVSELNEMFTALMYRMEAGEGEVRIAIPSTQFLSEQEKGERDKRIRENLAAGLYGEGEVGLSVARREMGLDV